MGHLGSLGAHIVKVCCGVAAAAAQMQEAAAGNMVISKQVGGAGASAHAGW